MCVCVCVCVCVCTSSVLASPAKSVYMQDSLNTYTADVLLFVFYEIMDYGNIRIMEILGAMVRPGGFLMRLGVKASLVTS